MQKMIINNNTLSHIRMFG